MAVTFSAKAIVHGHLHMPYVCQYAYGETEEEKIAIISAGSALFPAKGPFAKEIRKPSCTGIRFSAGKIEQVTIYTDNEAS